jgi:hypothetical protein
MWRKDPNAKELTWYTCFDLDDVQVLTVRVESPKALFLQESSCLNYLVKHHSK